MPRLQHDHGAKFQMIPIVVLSPPKTTIWAGLLGPEDPPFFNPIANPDESLLSRGADGKRVCR